MKTPIRHRQRLLAALSGIATAILLSVLPASAQVTNGLIGYWSFDSGTGADSSGNNLNGQTNNGATSVAGKGGGAMSFNGTTAHMVVPFNSALNVSSGITLALWLKPNSWAGVQNYIFGRVSDGVQNQSIYGLFRQGSQLSFHLQSGFINSENQIVSIPQPALGQWVHLTVTWSGSTMQFYTNGILASTATTTSSGPIQGGTNALYFAKRQIINTSPDYYFDGALDEVRLYNRALSGSEVRQLLTEVIAGSVSFSGTQLGLIWVQATTNVNYWSNSVATQLPSPGNYALTVLGGFTNWWVRAYLDANGNRTNDVFEAQGLYGSNPAVLIGNTISNINIELKYPDIDSDNDGLPDWWESLYFTNSTIASPFGDDDSDQLGNLVEYQIGSNPKLPDSDNDGIQDGIEYYSYGTNPGTNDTDGDGIFDKWEQDNNLNPLINDANEDRDLDGVSNLTEFINQGIGYRANIANSKHPGLSDFESLFGVQTNRFYYDKIDRLVGAEYNHGSNGLSIAYVYDGNGNILRQNYLQRDTNGNGLPDLWEFLNGLTNNPGAYVDSDGDGWSNWQEWKVGTSPTNCLSIPTNAPQTAPVSLPLPPTNTLSGQAAVFVRLWDAEGNRARPFLQFSNAFAPIWSNATLLTIDGTNYLTLTNGVTARPTGTTHQVVWNASGDLGQINTNLYLRTRAADLSLTGDWSVMVLYSVNTLATNPDSDGDRIPDAWETQYFGNLSRSGTNDFDGDGALDLAEYTADTNPTNAASYLHFTGVHRIPSGVKLDWLGGSNATQYLQRALFLNAGGSWSNLITNLPPTPITGSFTDVLDTNVMKFYRFEVMR